MVQISLYLFTTAKEDDLSTHHTSGISLSVFGWSKITFHTMNTLTNDNSDLIGPHVKYNDIHGLSTFRISDRNRFVFHGIMSIPGAASGCLHGCSSRVMHDKIDLGDRAKQEARVEEQLPSKGIKQICPL